MPYGPCGHTWETSGPCSTCLPNGVPPLGPLRIDDSREFLLVLRQGLLLIVRYIEKKYDLTSR